MHRGSNARSTLDNYSIEPPSGKKARAKSILPSINGLESHDSLFGDSKSVRNLDESKIAIHLGASTVADTRM